MSKSPVLLIDGDAHVYRCGFAGEKTKYLVNALEAYREFDTAKEAKAWADTNKGLGGHIWSRKEYEPIENVLQMVKYSLQQVLDLFKTNEYRIYIGGRGNFRNDIYPDYKANRDGVAKPRYYREIREYLVAHWGASLVDGMEADDAIGIDNSRTPGAIIVAVDKDLDQLKGRHFNWVTGVNYDVTAESGLRFFYEQLLSGDNADNIPGLKGVGAITAKKIVKEFKTPKEIAHECYRRYELEFGSSAREIIERNSKLLWIRRDGAIEHPFFDHLG